MVLQMEDVKKVSVEQREKFQEEMRGEQGHFVDYLESLDDDVLKLEGYDSIDSVAEAVSRHKHRHGATQQQPATAWVLLATIQAALVAETEAKLVVAEEKARLFNNREGLFNTSMTDYERVGAIRKNFEPYSNLWGTTQKWLQNHDQWVHGSFQNLNAEEVEKDVDAYFNTISKAVKFFEREQKEKQGGKAIIP